MTMPPSMPWTNGWMDGWTGGRVGGWVDGWMGGWTDGWMGGWVDGRVGGWDGAWLSIDADGGGCRTYPEPFRLPAPLDVECVLHTLRRAQMLADNVADDEEL